MIAKRRSTGIDNRLLAALPADDYARIALTLEVIPLQLKQYLHKPGEPLVYVYFPGGGFCSIVTVLKDGRMVEMATVGREGMIGLAAISGGRQGSTAVMVQGRFDTCQRMAIADFDREMARRGALYDLLTDYTRALTGSIMQSTACNAVHSIEQRLARWLLTARDRMASSEFLLTQEFVAMMLGATRPTVTLVAGTLQKAGLITYRRGHLTILKRGRLEETSCECYGTTAALMNSVTTRRERDRGR